MKMFKLETTARNLVSNIEDVEAAIIIAQHTEPDQIVTPEEVFKILRHCEDQEYWLSTVVEMFGDVMLEDEYISADYFRQNCGRYIRYETALAEGMNLLMNINKFKDKNNDEIAEAVKLISSALHEEWNTCE